MPIMSHTGSRTTEVERLTSFVNDLMTLRCIAFSSFHRSSHRKRRCGSTPGMHGRDRRRVRSILLCLPVGVARSGSCAPTHLDLPNVLDIPLFAKSLWALDRVIIRALRNPRPLREVSERGHLHARIYSAHCLRKPLNLAFAEVSQFQFTTNIALSQP
jgi:hypothetical protein